MAHRLTQFLEPQNADACTLVANSRLVLVVMVA